MTKELWPQESEDDWKFVILAINSDPCLVRWDSRKRYYVQTDFCQMGMGFVCLQTANDDVLMAAMTRKMAGGDCEFMRYPPKDIPNKIMLSLNPV